MLNKIINENLIQNSNEILIHVTMKAGSPLGLRLKLESVTVPCVPPKKHLTLPTFLYESVRYPVDPNRLC